MEVGDACLQLHSSSFTQLEGLNHMEQKILASNQDSLCTSS